MVAINTLYNLLSFQSIRPYSSILYFNLAFTNIFVSYIYFRLTNTYNTYEATVQNKVDKAKEASFCTLRESFYLS